MKNFPKISIIIFLCLAGLTVLFIYFSRKNSTLKEEGGENIAPDRPIEIEPDSLTGLAAGEGLQLVRSNCTACHSSALILQNRFTREGWHDKIVWMQQTQGLWDLGENEAVILDYLSTYYSPEAAASSRRRPLENIEWYPLEN